MKKFVVLKGLPGCGKSTWAEEFLKENSKDWVRINNDLISTMLFGDPFVDGKSHVIESVRNSLIDKFMNMQNSKNIIIDNTNLHPGRVEEYKELCERHNAFNTSVNTHNLYTFEIKDFTDVPLDVCLERNSKRIKQVPVKVIKDMYNKYIKTQQTYKEPELDLPLAIIVDLDGTVADISHRSPFDFKKVSEDKPIVPVINLVRSMKASGYEIIYISGREEKALEDTKEWLRKQKLPDQHVYLNKNGEKRASDITKKEIFDTNVKGKYAIAFVLEDRDKNVKAWRKMGYRCLQVDEGSF